VLAVSDPGDLRKKQIRSKNLALLAVLVALCLLFYAITIARMGSGS
jgi:hypothetical protein